MKLLRKFLISTVALVLSCTSFAETGSVAARVEVIPASIITAEPMGSITDPVEGYYATPMAVGGAWSKTAFGPTIYQKGIYYYLNLLPVGTIPASATITSVVFNWGLSYKPSGLLVYLCHESTSLPCVNVTNVQSGSTSYFNNKAANKKLIYAFGVSGTGTLSPTAFGKNDQVIVNYQY